MPSHHPCPSARVLWLTTASLLLALPWLNPFTWGPVASLLQWLGTALALAGLLLLGALWRAGGARGSAPWAQAIAWGWLLAGALSSLMALLQYTGHSAAWAPWVNITNTGEAFANLRQRNQFATLTNMALASLCWAAVAGAPSQRGRVGYVVLAVLLGVAFLGEAWPRGQALCGALLIVAGIVLFAWIVARDGARTARDVQALRSERGG